MLVLAENEPLLLKELGELLISGYPKIRLSCGCAVTMCLMTSGNGRDFCRPRKAMWCITAISKNSHHILRWMMDNIFIRTDPAGNIKADKEKSTEKIDGAVATIMGLDRAIRCGNVVTESVYDHRGILFL